MRKLALMAVLTSGLAYGQASADNCTWVNNPNEWFITPDGYIVPFPVFETAPYVLPVASTPYLRRLAAAVAAQGTQLVTVPVPNQGVVLAETMGKRFGPGTKFAEMTTPEGRKQLRAAYEGTLASLKVAGLTSFNVADALISFQRRNPTAELYLRRDNHWQVAGARAAGEALAAYLLKNARGKFVQEDNGLNVTLDSQITLDARKEYERLAGANCASAKLPIGKETYPTVRLERQVTDQESALFSDKEPSGAVLVGSSYTASPPELGFAPYLSAALNAEVLNASITGGGALGSITEYYSTLASDAPSPTLLLWEFPAVNVSLDNMSDGFAVNRLRQALPWVNRTATTIELLNGTTPTYTPTSKVMGHGYFIEFVFTGKTTRGFKATLQYDGGQSETVDMINPRGQQLQRYRLELPDNGQSLERLSLTFNEPGPWDVSSRLYRYVEPF